MKTQILIIGGGNVAETHGAYLQYLRDRRISLDHFRSGLNWKNNLQGELGDGFDVLILPMPNKDNARYSEWKIWFNRIAPLLDDGVILIGHSMGGIFLMKHLSENAFPRRILATFLLAAPFVIKDDYMLADFYLHPKLPGVAEQAGRVFVYHSEDDRIVPIECARLYEKALPTPTVRIFQTYGHLNEREFPELIADIRSLI